MSAISRADEAYVRVADVQIVQQGFGRNLQGPSYAWDWTIFIHVVKVEPTSSMIDLTPGRSTMPWPPPAEDVVTIAFSKRSVSCWRDSHVHRRENLQSAPIWGATTHLENLWILDATIISKVVDGADSMGGYIGKSKQHNGGVLESDAHNWEYGVHQWLGRFAGINSTRLRHLEWNRPKCRPYRRDCMWN